ncbi:NYN domain-containing protein [Caballeronia sp. LZ029]|uniref:NYN domain-containing protein n=1 Tax=Caballeronia sp. LZ029 TaxID=3038564 RepID=UPI00285CF9AC|nr:NYN domain-containing protein [Caballeronia sp. LZ029]MDR5748828.1 NYN domain-containing protein [Caballeronia sp. LZ029]
MDLLYAGNVDGFCIVFSDSDFTRLATRLREAGKLVYGLGERKTPEPFIAACDKFVFFEVLRKTGDKAEAISAAGVPDLKRLLIHAINETSRDGGWAPLSTVGSFISKSNTLLNRARREWSNASSLLLSMCHEHALRRLTEDHRHGMEQTRRAVACELVAPLVEIG